MEVSLPTFQDTLLPSFDRIQDQPFPVSPPPVVLPENEASNMSPSEIPKAIVSLFLEYHNSLSQLKSLPAVASDTSVAPIAQLSVDVNTRTDLFMSKAQLQLTLEEGKLWRKIFTPQDQPGPTTDLAVNELAQKSSIMSASYLRRTHTPTERTYGESKAILQAMGIPCIESAGPFEAEALAAAIVSEGWADYVASEDTVRLCVSCPNSRHNDTAGRARIRSSSDAKPYQQERAPDGDIRRGRANHAQP